MTKPTAFSFSADAWFTATVLFVLSYAWQLAAGEVTNASAIIFASGALTMSLCILAAFIGAIAWVARHVRIRIELV